MCWPLSGKAQNHKPREMALPFLAQKPINIQENRSPGQSNPPYLLRKQKRKIPQNIYVL